MGNKRYYVVARTGATMWFIAGRYHFIYSANRTSVKKHLPNILLFIVVLANIFFMARYILSHGTGMFFSTTGIVFLILGIVIFIFFLSIDPGYGWTRSMDLTKNYIMIFTSMAVVMAGVVLIVVGQQMNELHVQSVSDAQRCSQLRSGNAEEVLKKDWYRLRDRESGESFNVYLFQKKSNRNNYKIIATVDDAESNAVKDLTIHSLSIPSPIAVSISDSECPGVFEKNISIDFAKHQKMNEHIQFDLLLTLIEQRSKKIKSVRFSLKNEPSGSGQGFEPVTRIGTQVKGWCSELDLDGLCEQNARVLCRRSPRQPAVLV